MRLNLKSTNYELTAQIKKHVEDKFGELDKYFSNKDGKKNIEDVTEKRPAKRKNIFL